MKMKETKREPVATREQLELVIAAMWRDLDAGAKRRDPYDSEWDRGYRDALAQARNLVGIALKTYRIPTNLGVPKTNNEKEN